MGLKTKCYPKSRFKNVLEITDSFLKENKIKGIILDIDNTLMDYDGNILNGIHDWIANLQNQGIKFCILTNTKTKANAYKMSQLLNNIPYVYFAKKPFKSGFKKAQKKIEIENEEEIAVVGDQIMTDILRSKPKPYVFYSSISLRKA